MDVVIETDIGRDPDDFFAICYLHSAGVNIRGIAVTPGDKDQIAVAKFLCDQLGLKIPVASANPERSRQSVGGIHIDLLEKYKAPGEAKPDCAGADMLRMVFDRYPDARLFVIGPLDSTGKYLARGGTVKKALMQGGFVGYSQYPNPPKRLEKFEGKSAVPTFNLNGNVQAAKLFLESPIQRRFVGKNVCHTAVYDAARHRACLAVKPRDRGGELLREGMAMYLERHGDERVARKLFHDPTAAVCLVHPEVGTWITGKLYRDEKGCWGTKIVINPVALKTDLMLVNIDPVQLWTCIMTGT